MNGPKPTETHPMDAFTTYPFSIFGNGWERVTPTTKELPYKGDTVVGLAGEEDHPPSRTAYLERSAGTEKFIGTQHLK